MWTDVLGKKIAYAGDDRQAFERRAASHGSSAMAYDQALMFEWWQKIGVLATSGAVERLTGMLGRPLRTYGEFARESALQWNSSCRRSFVAIWPAASSNRWHPSRKSMTSKASLWASGSVDPRSTVISYHRRNFIVVSTDPRPRRPWRPDQHLQPQHAKTCLYEKWRSHKRRSFHQARCRRVNTRTPQRRFFRRRHS